jgi:hypothetical protein
LQKEVFPAHDTASAFVALVFIRFIRFTNTELGIVDTSGKSRRFVSGTGACSMDRCYRHVMRVMGQFERTHGRTPKTWAELEEITDEATVGYEAEIDEEEAELSNDEVDWKEA